MNKLVIIGNGFDLAHGLKTRYLDFILNYLNEVLVGKNKYPLISIDTNFADTRKIPIIKSFRDFDRFVEDFNIKVTYSNQFIEKIVNLIDVNWIDIETMYFEELKNIFVCFKDDYQQAIIQVRNLNDCMNFIKLQLKLYLSKINTSENFSQEMRDLLKNQLDCFDVGRVCFLNFNYTETLWNYCRYGDENLNINFIHGQLKPDLPIVFGYGDEIDTYYKEMEDSNIKEYTEHFKPFNYTLTDNYQSLFKFLDKDIFDVYIMGHSCGISDRVLFTNIFKHKNFNQVKIYYHKYGEKDFENDFFQKTQELSRHFDINFKHIMRTKIVSLTESKPLPQYKTK
jgi:hypothetical protein